MAYNPLILSYIKRSERAQALFCGISSPCPDLQLAASLVNQDLRNILNAGVGHVQETSQYLQDPARLNARTINLTVMISRDDRMSVVLIFNPHAHPFQHSPCRVILLGVTAQLLSNDLGSRIGPQARPGL